MGLAPMFLSYTITAFKLVSHCSRYDYL